MNARASGASGAPLAPGLTTANVTLCDSLSCPGTNASQPTGQGLINLVTVTVTGYAYSSLVQFVMPNITFNNISVTMRAQL